MSGLAHRLRPRAWRRTAAIVSAAVLAAMLAFEQVLVIFLEPVGRDRWRPARRTQSGERVKGEYRRIFSIQ